MARTALTVNVPDRDGVAVTAEPADATNGNSFAWTGREYLIIENGDTASHTGSIATADTVDGLTIPTKDVSVAAGATVIAGPWPDLYEQAPDSLVHLDWDGDTSVTVIVMQAP